MTKVPVNAGTRWLVMGGWLSLAAALLHVGCIIGGADWYRFFGAGEEMAAAAEAGKLFPHLVTAGIAGIIALWAAYAFSGAGRIARLPLLRTGLVVITAIYLLRALLLLPLLILRPELVTAFDLWSSAIVLFYGLAHLAGLARAWPTLSAKQMA